MASAYRPWAMRAGPDLELWCAVLPGRGSRAAERTASHMPTLADELAHAIRSRTDKPYALFGHSMGALLAYEVARRLDARGPGRPRGLFVSSAPCPDAPRSTLRLKGLPDADLIRCFRQLGGIPAVVAENPEAMAAALPALRADLELMQTYQPPVVRPLECPITALGGLDDPMVAPPALAEWRRWTRASFKLRMLPGDHFYLQANTTTLLALFESELGVHRCDVS